MGSAWSEKELQLFPELLMDSLSDGTVREDRCPRTHGCVQKPGLP